LEVVLQIPFSFQQDVRTDNALFVKRQILLQYALRNFGLECFDLHLRTGIDHEVRTHPVVRLVVFRFLELDARSQTILALVFRPKTLHARAGSRSRHLLPPVNDRVAPPGRSQHDRVRQ